MKAVTTKSLMSKFAFEGGGNKEEFSKDKGSESTRQGGSKGVGPGAFMEQSVHEELLETLTDTLMLKHRSKQDELRQKQQQITLTLKEQIRHLQEQLRQAKNAALEELEEFKERFTQQEIEPIKKQYEEMVLQMQRQQQHQQQQQQQQQQNALPRLKQVPVSSSMNLAELKAEYKARFSKHKSRDLPMNGGVSARKKNELLAILVEGSEMISLSGRETRIEKLKELSTAAGEKVANAERELWAVRAAMARRGIAVMKELEDGKKREREEEWRKEEVIRREAEAKRKEEQKKERAEMERKRTAALHAFHQKYEAKHVHKFPNVYEHPLCKTSDITTTFESELYGLEFGGGKQERGAVSAETLQPVTTPVPYPNNFVSLPSRRRQSSLFVLQENFQGVRVSIRPPVGARFAS